MDIGFYLLDIEATNKKHKTILESINSLCDLRPYDNIVLFNNKMNNVDLDHKYYVLHMSQAKYFKGYLFLFDMRSSMVTQQFPAPKKQIMFIDNNDWSSKADVPYVFWEKTYLNDNFEFVANNKELYDIFELCWKKPLSIINDYNYRGIDEILRKL